MVPRVLTTNGKQAFLPVLMLASLSLIGRPSKLVALKDISATVGLLRLIVDTMKLSKSNFRALDCRDCPSCDKCTRSVPPRRTLTIRPQEQYLALQQARDLLTTKQSTLSYSLRQGVEGTVSQGVRAFGMRRSRYVGHRKTHLQHVAIASALNLVRLAAWLHGERPEKTRTSAFIKLFY